MKKQIINLCLVIILNFIALADQNTLAEEYLWAGANQYQLWFQTDARIRQQLDAMQDAGLKVLRIFLGQRPYQGWEDPSHAYTFENPQGTYEDDNLEKVDYLMSECSKRGIKLIIALNNHSDLYFDTYGAKRMYSASSSITAYKNRFNYFLNHFNSYLQKSWKDCNNVVYAWEIQNEPGIPLINYSGLTSAERHEIIRDFLAELSTYLKSIDSNTKVALGIAGYANYYHSGKSGDDIRTLGNIEDADIYTLHFYGGDLNKWIDDNLSYCRSINKLLFIEEFGKTRDVGMTSLISHYKYVAEICRIKGVPWMFWRLGHRKGGTCFCINSDDDIWQQVIIPETEKINLVATNDAWGININTAIEAPIKNKLNNKFINCYPNPFNNTVQFQIQNFSPEIKLRILNIRGEIVFYDNIYNNNRLVKYKWNGTDTFGNNLSSGIYILTVQGKQKSSSEKIFLLK